MGDHKNRNIRLMEDFVLGYQILMDSCGDVSGFIKESGKVKVVPLHIRIGAGEYTDDGTLNIQEMIKLLKRETGKIGSSCPSPYEYTKRCDRTAERVYILTGSSSLTGSYGSAVLAADILRKQEKQRKQQIAVFDTKSASAGEALICLKIMEWERERKPFEDIQKGICRVIRRMETRFVLEDVSMLERSGRLTGVRAKLAEVLRICPVFCADGEGKIGLSGQGRGMKRALSLMKKQIEKDLFEGIEGTIVISHCRVPGRALNMKADILAKFPESRVRIMETGGISSLYAGKGGIIVAYIKGTAKKDR